MGWSSSAGGNCGMKQLLKIWNKRKSQILGRSVSSRGVRNTSYYRWMIFPKTGQFCSKWGKYVYLKWLSKQLQKSEKPFENIFHPKPLFSRGTVFGSRNTELAFMIGLSQYINYKWNYEGSILQKDNNWVSWHNSLSICSDKWFQEKAVHSACQESQAWFKVVAAVLSRAISTSCHISRSVKVFIAMTSTICREQ